MCKADKVQLLRHRNHCIFGPHSKIPTWNTQQAVCIAKIGIRNMHLPQVKEQVEDAAGIGPVAHQTACMPQHGAQQIIGRKGVWP